MEKSCQKNDSSTQKNDRKCNKKFQYQTTKYTIQSKKKGQYIKFWHQSKRETSNRHVIFLTNQFGDRIWRPDRTRRRNERWSIRKKHIYIILCISDIYSEEKCWVKCVTRVGNVPGGEKYFIFDRVEERRTPKDNGPTFRTTAPPYKQLLFSTAFFHII